MKKQHQNKPAFVLGNGQSRLSIDAKSLLNLGTIYGCNAIYREMDPHVLVAVDVKMINEIIDSGYHLNNEVWTNPNKGIKTRNRINLYAPHKGWSSGPTALWHACSDNFQEIYIFGFDYQGRDGKFNNVYADTHNYKRSSDSATYFGNWLNQTEKTIKEFKKVQFYRVINEGAFIPDKLGPKLANLKHITFENFKSKFPDTIYTSQTIQKTTI